MVAIEDAIAHGHLGIQGWVDREVRFRFVRNPRDRGAFRFIPVVGEGADIATYRPSSNSINGLICAITGTSSRKPAGFWRFCEIVTVGVRNTVGILINTLPVS